MEKTYNDLMREISRDELYRGLLAFGMFSEKLPPIFTSEGFFDYCQTKQHNFQDKPCQLISYKNMRNTNVPRHLSIPNPFAYQLLCECLSDNWSDMLDFFDKNTKKNRHKVSRIHIRKMLDTEALFVMDYDIPSETPLRNELLDMTYKDWRTDGTPETDMLLGKRWVVNADISNCFPSIYTHSIPWAIAGKDVAKDDRTDRFWYNKIDKRGRNIKDGETNGLPIGPHTSNLLSEIILVAVDNELRNGKQKWDYVRNIDDYACYVESREKAELFLTELNRQIGKYNLSLNHKKTEILELPTAATTHWVRRMDYISNFERKGRLDYKSVRAYLDLAVELMEKNSSNSSILKYAVKVLSRQEGLTTNANIYAVKTVMNLSVIYPYLVGLLDKYVFVPLGVNSFEIKKYCNVMLNSALISRNYEAAAYCVYFALKYKFVLVALNADIGIDSGDCVFLVLLHLYFKANKIKPEKKKLVKHAEDLAKSSVDFEQYWLFIYEILPKKDLPSDAKLREWKAIKEQDVSFIRKDILS
ncbi:MAG: RNA-directed DNA polymerase [Clostridiales bacterium]|jgi:hypothetical protein|nr:RNA-directed DNA polymerase [Clostridiales bacterium]